MWHESDTPLSVISDPSSLGHLSFGVWIQAAPNTYDARSATFQDAGWIGDPDGVDPDNLAEIDARVRVAFCFEIRNPNGTADARQATDAALDVVRGLMAPWSAADEADGPGYSGGGGLRTAVADCQLWAVASRPPWRTDGVWRWSSGQHCDGTIAVSESTRAGHVDEIHPSVRARVSEA